MFNTCGTIKQTIAVFAGKWKHTRDCGAFMTCKWHTNKLLYNCLKVHNNIKIFLEKKLTLIFS